MEKKLQDSLDAWDKHLKNMSEEEKAKMEEYFRDDTPKGWLSIEDHLPKCLAMDFCQKGYSVYKVKDKDGNEFETQVSDHNIWYYIAKENGVTHWLNE